MQFSQTLEVFSLNKGSFFKDKYSLNFSLGRSLLIGKGIIFYKEIFVFKI
jgi:hypothetical protein